MERGPRYEVYAQLRESNLQSKRLKLYEFDPISETPTSEFSSPVKKSDGFDDNLGDFEGGYRVSGLLKPGFLKKSVKFHGISEDFEENEQVCKIPKSEYSPVLKKPMKHRRISGNFEENERVSAIPKPEFLRKSVNFYGVSSNNEENVQICEIPKSEFSPILKKKSMKFQGKTGEKQRYSVLAQSVPDFSSAMRKENRKPPMESVNVKNGSLSALKSTRERVYGSVVKYGVGSKCVNTGEKQSMKGVIGRKSYASIEELKGVSNGENKRGRNSRKSTLFSTNYY